MAFTDDPTFVLPPPGPPDDALAPGETLGGCRVERLLGQGGMGSVYLAVQESLGRQVALKVMASRFAQDESFVKRFHREASALAALSHPNIVAIHDQGASGGRYFLVMEYVEGVSLRQVLQKAMLDPGDALKLVPQACAALEYAHAKGVVHRDIKPENLIVTRDGALKVADFGLARLGGERPSAALTGPQTVMGTFHYMAPELQESAALADARSDLYSLGVVLYEMLTGTLPIGRFDPPSRKRPVDARLDEVVLKCLEADPARRWSRAGEVGEAVARITTTPPPASLQAEMSAAVKEIASSAPAGGGGEFVGRREEARPAKVRGGAGPSASVKEALMGRRKGEARRKWKARLKAMGFLGVALLAFLALYFYLPEAKRARLLVPAGAVLLLVAAAAGRKALRSR